MRLTLDIQNLQLHVNWKFKLIQYFSFGSGKMFHITTLLHLVVMFTLAQQRIVYILPNDQPTIQCPVDLEDCCSLNVLISGDLFSGRISNTTIALLPGTHTVSTTVNKVVYINSAINLTLKAANYNSTKQAIVRCNGTIGFAFSSTINLTISGIVFTQCGVSASNNGLEIFTVSITYSYNVSIINSTIKMSKGTGLLVQHPHGRFVLSGSYNYDYELH